VECAVSEAEIDGPESTASRMLGHVVNAAFMGVASDDIKERVAFARDYMSLQLALACALKGMETGAEAEARVSVSDVERHAIRLLRGGGLPRKFWPVLVYEICHVIDQVPTAACFLSTDSIYEFLSAMEVISSTLKTSRELENLSRRIRNQAGSLNGRNTADVGRMELRSLALTHETLDRMQVTLLHALSASFRANVS
jgi:hypothetical protein